MMMMTNHILHSDNSQQIQSPQSIADYLAQLLKDRKQLAALPNVFTHLERLLDEGESRRVNESLSDSVCGYFLDCAESENENEPEKYKNTRLCAFIVSDERGLRAVTGLETKLLLISFRSTARWLEKSRREQRKTAAAETAAFSILFPSINKNHHRQ